MDKRALLRFKVRLFLNVIRPKFKYNICSLGFYLLIFLYISKMKVLKNKDILKAFQRVISPLKVNQVSRFDPLFIRHFSSFPLKLLYGLYQFMSCLLFSGFILPTQYSVLLPCILL